MSVILVSVILVSVEIVCITVVTRYVTNVHAQFAVTIANMHCEIIIMGVVL